ncbi:MAG: hypothetical protein IKP65_04310 [Alphaproteobacteria bacterium]|nr:hypothetical protein [Alphaproteobacteria bacterium]
MKLIENPTQDFTKYNLDNCSFYLDENNEIKIEYKASSLKNAHMARDEHYYEYSEDNRIHLMHWEYCHYYNLMRIYRWDYSTQRYYPRTDYYNHILYIYTVPYEDLEYQNELYESKKYIFTE